MRVKCALLAVAFGAIVAGSVGLGRGAGAATGRSAVALTNVSDVPAQAAASSAAPDERTGEVIVKFRRGATLGDVGEALSDADSQATASTAGSGLVLLDPEPGQSDDAAIASLRSRGDVEFAEPNHVVHLAATPTDPMYASNQWSLPQIGLTTAWNTSTGSASVIVAVVDTGVDGAHADLSGKITSGANAGFNFVANNTNTSDDHFHGTFVASIIAANTNNGAGGAGVCWACKIMPVKVLDNTGSGSTFNVAQGVDWAVAHGAKVINMSLGSSSPDSTLLTSVNNAWNAGVIVVAASGNDNGPVLYPAAYANVIAVGSNNQAGAKSSFSNFGPELDLMAPGEGVFGALCTCGAYAGGYGTGSGTSFASPHLAGVVGLLISAGITDKNTIRTKLQTTATDMGTAGFDNSTGWGRVNAAAAISSGTPTPTSTPTNTRTATPTRTNTPTATPTVPDTTPPTVNVTSPANGATVSGVITINATATDNKAMQKVRFSADATYLGYDATSPYSITLNTATLANGAHTISARALDMANNANTATITINVSNSDTTAPTVSITGPANGATVAGSITINATAADNVAVQKVRFSADATYLGFDSSGPYSMTLDTTTLSNGSHVLSARALDNANNSTTATIVIHVNNSDTTPPTVSTDAPADGATVAGTIAINVTASDDVGVQKVRFSADTTYLGYDASSPYSMTLDTTALGNGPHSISARALDNANNATTAVININVNN